MFLKDSPADRWIDRWGHVVFWMGPYITIVSTLAWTPRLALLLAGVETIQFTIHVRDDHPTHPMTPISFLFMVLGAVMIVIGSIVYPLVLASYILIVWQCLFSQSIHWSTHGHVSKWLWCRPLLFALSGLYTVRTMIGHVYIPGHPLMRAFLL
ncbi:MAG: hypothetical protein WC654_01115 [Patescibacteria group bacterium]